MARDAWTTESLDKTIVELTKKAWGDGLPILLSDLGTELTKFADYRTVIQPLRLRQHIATRLSDQVSIVTHPKQPQKTGLIPAGEKFSFTGESDLPAEEEVPAAASKGGERVRPSLWAAFVKPLAGDCERYLDIGDEAFRFVDVKEGGPVPGPTFKSVARELITDGKSSLYDARQVSSTIHTWAREHSLAPEKLYIRESSSRPKSRFFEIFEGLSESELRRIEIPFDIIVKLAQK